jgi:RimJ/RimL family protein N-acetyltransferase
MMPIRVPLLETPRLIVREFVLDDLDAVHQLMKRAWGEEQPLEQRRRWLQWAVLNYEALANLYQPPYGDRAVVLKADNRLIGAVGYVPCLNAFGHYGYYQQFGDTPDDDRTFPEFGLYYAFDPDYRRQGYASEATQAMIDFAFAHLRLRRIVATTEFHNEGSMGVMRRLGMRIEKNPDPNAPPWLQVVGILENKG